MVGFELEPERGVRCGACFDMRMEVTVMYAHENGFQYFTTTNATSRWKDETQVNLAGVRAAQYLRKQLGLTRTYTHSSSEVQTDSTSSDGGTGTAANVKEIEKEKEQEESKKEGEGEEEEEEEKGVEINNTDSELQLPQFWIYSWQTDRMTRRKYEVSVEERFYKQEYVNMGCV